MGKSVHADVLDGALLVLRNNVTRMVACLNAPASYADADGAQKLAAVTMAPADFVLAAGDVSGRKVTVATKAGVAVVASGSATHVALLDVSGSRLLYVTTCPTQVLVSGGTVTFSAWDVEIGAPV